MDKENHSTPNAELDELIARYINDHGDQEAIKGLTTAAKASDDARGYIRRKLELWFASAPVDESYDADAAFRRFEAATGVGTEPQSRTVKMRHFLWAAVAAAVVLLAILPWAGYRYAVDSTRKAMAEMQVEAPAGSSTTVTLPDGTKVWLNAASRITYSQGFGLDDRTLSLSGEACFDVTRNEKLPFIVKTASASLKVLGTKFTYRDYTDDSTMVVDLIRGHVALTGSKTGDNMDMLPGERVTIDKRTGLMSKTSIDTQQSDGWTRGELFFDESTMQQIAKELSRHYGVKVEVAGALKSETFYGSFDTRKASLEQVLRTLSETKRMKYKYAQGRYILY